MLDIPLETIPRLPPKTSSFGQTTLKWYEFEPGYVWIQTEGGSLPTRHLASLLLASDLKDCGYLIHWDKMPSLPQKKSAWTDVLQKGVRLFKDGQVTMLRNSYEQVMGQVEGDHGVYTPWFTRQDPSSAVWTQSGCTCLAPGSKIVMADGSVKLVEDIATGDLVLTETGQVGQVARTFQNQYDGDLYGFNPIGSTETVWVTADHKLFTPDGPKEAKDWTEEDFTYMPALSMPALSSTLTVSDYIKDGALVDKDGTLYKQNKLAGRRRSLIHQPLQDRGPLETLPYIDDKQFWANVDKTNECWEWQGSIDASTNVPKYRTSSTQLLPARRVAWQLTTGEEIFKRTQFLAKCKNKKCVAPHHCEPRERVYEREIIPEYSTCRHPFPTELNLNNNFMRLAGLFLAEGSACLDGEIVWSFNINEFNLAEEICHICKMEWDLDTHIQIPEDKNSIIVSTSCLTLSLLLRSLFGYGAKTKRIHPILMRLSGSRLKIFMEAWILGDGHEAGTRRGLDTSSIDLAMQARLLLATLGHESVIRHKKDNISKLVPGGTSIYRVTWRRDPAKHMGQRFIEGDLVLNKSLITKKKYCGMVYNFEVVALEEQGYDEHTYVIWPGIASANCPWEQYRWLRTRNFRKYEGRACAHLIALAYQSAVTPLDEDVHPATQFGQNPQQSIPGAEMQQTAPPGTAGYDINQAPAQDFRVLNQNDPWANVQPLPPQPSQQPPFISTEPLLIPMQAEDYQKALQEQLQNAPYSQINLNSPLPGSIDNRGTLSHIILVSTDMQFQQGDTVRINVDTMAQKEGPDQAIDNGEWVDIPRNTRGEVFDVDASTGWVSVLFPMPGPPMTVPYPSMANMARSYMEPSTLTLINRGGLKTPFIYNPKVEGLE